MSGLSIPSCFIFFAEIVLRRVAAPQRAPGRRKKLRNDDKRVTSTVATKEKRVYIRGASNTFPKQVIAMASAGKMPLSRKKNHRLTRWTFGRFSPWEKTIPV
ncbi:hypothetical protein CWM52_09210 [Raoultella sp. T31]|nr:hypothetical protein CWM52_09210 [Raoultella sp. T31]